MATKVILGQVHFSVDECDIVLGQLAPVVGGKQPFASEDHLG